MAFNRATLPDLITRTTNDLISRLALVTPVLRRALVRIIPTAWSNLVDALHYHISWASRQFLISTCDDDMLPQHGAELGISQLTGAFAAGDITIAGGAASSPIAAGTLWKRTDGVQYALSANGALDGSGSATLAVTALVAGVNGNADAGTTLTLMTSVPGVPMSATVATGGIVDGVDPEMSDAYRARMLAIKRKKPQGGADADYEIWAEQVPGVTRVWVRRKWLGPGTVGVLFVMDGQAGSILPDAGMVSTVQTYIDDPTRCPVTAEVHVEAPDLYFLDLSVRLTPDTPDGRTAATAEMEDLLLREGEPGVCPALDEIQKSASNAAGVQYAKITGPTVEPVLAPNQLPQLRTITWVA
jgi:uncharacterized phage protein gp47/JayE